MKFENPLQSARLIKRYKRFLADIRLEDGSEITIHCPNTGSMKNCQTPDSRIWYTDSANPKRKYPCTWQFIETIDKLTQHLVGVNTGLANKLVVEALEKNVIAQLQGYQKLKTEVPYGDQNSRIDVFLSNHDGAESDCYVEVKNVSLGLGDGLASFPDSVTTRGQKHLQELMLVRKQGFRAVLLFSVQHTGIDRVTPADDIDPEYGRLLRLAAASGVEIFAYGVEVDVETSSVSMQGQIEVCL